MSETPDSTLADPQIIADLQRQLAEYRAERDRALAERDKAQRRLAERTAERDEALEQQTATSEVLQVINSSPGDLAPVFDAMLERAIRLCTPAFGVLFTWDGERFHRVAWRGGSEEAIEASRGAVIPPPGSPGYRLVQGENSVSIADLAADEIARTTPVQYLLRFGARSYVTVALRKEGRLLGMLTVYRQEVRPFTDTEIALLKNFAAQAVIATENARLLTETREALEQQTATAEVLGVINSSPGDLAPVFDAMVERAMRLCEASIGGIYSYEDHGFRAVALRGVPEAYEDFLQQEPLRPVPNSGLGRIGTGEPIVHIHDVAADEAYGSHNPAGRTLLELGGARTVLLVSLTKDDNLLGAIFVYRKEVRPFTDKQIALLQNFAAQAVIAMENARLLTETREALEQQTATAEVLQVINSSPGDLTPLFDAMLEKATRLCEAETGTFWTYDGEYMQATAVRGASPSFAEFLKQGPYRPDTGQSRLLRGARVIHHADMTETDGDRAGQPLLRA